MDKKQIKRNWLLDQFSVFFDGLTGGKKPDVAEGVERKPKTLYNTYGTKGDNNEAEVGKAGGQNGGTGERDSKRSNRKAIRDYL